MMNPFDDHFLVQYSPDLQASIRMLATDDKDKFRDKFLIPAQQQAASVAKQLQGQFPNEPRARIVYAALLAFNLAFDQSILRLAAFDDWDALLLPSNSSDAFEALLAAIPSPMRSEAT